MGTNCAPLVVDLFLFCYERDFMMSLSCDKQADVIDAFNTTSRYLDDIFNKPIPLIKTTFLDLHLSILNDIFSTNIYDKNYDFDFEIVNCHF